MSNCVKCRGRKTKMGEVRGKRRRERNSSTSLILRERSREKELRGSEEGMDKMRGK